MSGEKGSKIVPEAARAELKRWTDGNDLDVNKDHMDAEDRTSFEKIERRLLTAIGSGALVINEECRAIYTPQNKGSKSQEPVTFHECTGAALMAMDGKKKNQDVRKTFSVMAEMCKVPVATFSGMVGIDAKVCMGLFQLLMD